MPEDRSGDRHASKRRAFQLPDRRWQQFDEECKALGTTRARITTELVLWWLGHREHPPKRPERP